MFSARWCLLFFFLNMCRMTSVIKRVRFDWYVHIPRYEVVVSMVRMRGALPPRLFVFTVVTTFLNYCRQYLIGMERVGTEEFDIKFGYFCVYIRNFLPRLDSNLEDKGFCTE